MGDRFTDFHESCPTRVVRLFNVKSSARWVQLDGLSRFDDVGEATIFDGWTAIVPNGEGPSLDFRKLITVLDRRSVDYVLVGGAAAAMLGAERLTQDVDCVISRDLANLKRVAAALRELDARLRVAGMSDEEARERSVQRFR